MSVKVFHLRLQELLCCQEGHLWLGCVSRFSDSSICCRLLLSAVMRSRRRFFSFSVLASRK